MNLSRNGKLGAVAVVVVALAAGVSAYAITKHTSSASAATSGGASAAAATGQQDDRRGFGGRGFRGGGPGGGSLSAAATYLGLSTSDLFAQIRSGKTLAQIANGTSGKSASGLVDAMVSAEKTEIEQSVTSGRITRAQADQVESDLKTRVTEIVNRAGFGGPPGVGRGFGGPPGSGGGTSTTPAQHI